VVLGNPPWDIITIKKKEWFAAFNFEILTAKSKQQRDRVERGVLSDAHNAVAFRDYVNEFEGQKRINDLLYTRQKVTIEGDLAGRFLDTFRVFMERNAQLLDHNRDDGHRGPFSLSRERTGPVPSRPGRQLRPRWRCPRFGAMGPWTWLGCGNGNGTRGS